LKSLNSRGTVNDRINYAKEYYRILVNNDASEILPQMAVHHYSHRKLELEQTHKDMVYCICIHQTSLQKGSTVGYY
jgi:hypothetical protein